MTTVINAAARLRAFTMQPWAGAMFKKLKVYAGAEHPHTAQQPKTITF